MKWLRRIAIFLLVLLALLVVAYLFLCHWLKLEIEKQAEAKLEANVTISSVWFWPYSQTVILSEVEVIPKPNTQQNFLKNSTFRANRIFAWVNVSSALDGNIQLKSLRFEKPALKLSLVSLPELPPTVGDLTRLKGLLQQREHMANFFVFAVPLEKLEIEEGSFQIKLQYSNMKPVQFSLHDLHYKTGQLGIVQIDSLVADSYFRFDLSSGGHVEKEPGKFDATDLDLAFFSSVFGAKDIMKFASGTIDISWQSGKAVLLSLDNATVTGDPSLRKTPFTDQVSLQIQTTSEPLSLILQIWNGLWGAVVNDLEPDVKQRIQEHSARALETWLRRQ